MGFYGWNVIPASHVLGQALRCFRVLEWAWTYSEMWDAGCVDKSTGSSVWLSCRTGLTWLCIKETLVHEFHGLCTQLGPRLASGLTVHSADTHHATWVWGHLRKMLMLLPEQQRQPRLHCLGL